MASERWTETRLRHKWEPAVTQEGELPDLWLWACQLAGPRLVERYNSRRDASDMPGQLRCARGGSSRERPEIDALRAELGDPDAAVYKFQDRYLYMVAFSGASPAFRAAATRLKRR